MFDESGRLDLQFYGLAQGIEILRGLAIEHWRIWQQHDLIAPSSGHRASSNKITRGLSANVCLTRRTASNFRARRHKQTTPLSQRINYSPQRAQPYSNQQAAL